MREKVRTALRHLVIYSQEAVTALAWLAFAATADQSAPLIGTLENQYPSVILVFHLGWAITGIFLFMAIYKPNLFVPAWAFSAVVALSTHLATVAIVEDGNYSMLYPVTWGLFFLLSATQAVRHYWKKDGDCGD